MLELIYRGYNIAIIIVLIISFYGDNYASIFIFCMYIKFIFNIIDEPFRSIINESRLRRGKPTMEESYKM